MSPLMSPLISPFKLPPQLRSRLLPLCALTLATLGAHDARAQQNFQPSPSDLPPATSAAPANPGVGWVPAEMATLAQQSSSHSDFSFDRSTLSLFSNLPTLDASTRQTIGKLNGVALHLYRFPGGSYSPATVQAVRAEYDRLGWKHVSTSKPEPGFSGESASHTDVWLNTQGINVAGAVILLTGSTSVNLIAVSGDLSTLDLLRLRGHFGIPQFPSDALPH